MATMNDSVNGIVPATADLRKTSVDRHRAKNRKMRYRNVNVGMLGQPIDTFNFLVQENPNCQKWNNRNKFKMPNPNSQGGSSCTCQSCRNTRWESNTRSKARAQRHWDRDFDDTNDSVYDQDSIYSDALDGVIYSFDRPTGPSHGSQILTQALDVALDKLERKQFENLIKNEYDVIQSDESASSEDDEYEFV